MHAVGKMEGKKIERSFELFPAWLSLNPIHWMTKTSKIEMADAEQKEETQNLKSWFKLDFTPVQSNVKANKSKPYSSEKIKKCRQNHIFLNFDQNFDLQIQFFYHRLKK